MPRFSACQYTFRAILLAGSLYAQQEDARPARLGPWEAVPPSTLRMNEELLAEASRYALRGGGSGMVIHQGKLVYSWGDLKTRYDLKSSTKSIGSTVLGLAMQDRKAALDDLAARWLPEIGTPPEENRLTGWPGRITLFHLASQTAGFDKPGGFERLLFEPGTKWSYSDGGPNWLADVLTKVYGHDLQDLLFARVFDSLGITRGDLQWRENAYRPKTLDGIARREFGSGIHANVDAMARIGYLYLRAGGVGERRVLSSEFVARARSTPAAVSGLPVLNEQRYPNASRRYGLLWWNNNDGGIPGAPRDTYWSWGLYDSLIVVVPGLDLVLARAGKTLAPEGQETSAGLDRLRPLIEPVVAAVDPELRKVVPPYGPSPVITGIEWAPIETIRRAAHDCDNWPMTWTDQDLLFAACGDGRGFTPYTPKKMGLLFTEIQGGPETFTGRNLETNIDNTGMGARGRKASGLLMADGTLYLWARNAGNAQLAWSSDRGRTWTWAPWKFTVSFGHPAFLNFGRNNAGARDEYVYIYSPDHDSAYEPSPRLVLARVPKTRLRERASYEFFARLEGGRAVWTKDVNERGAVFENARDLCYRTQVSYHAPTKRYLLTYALPGPVNGRFQSGMGVFDAPEPWGPWTTVYYTKVWDSAAGESLSFPVKWMGADGRTVYLAGSGDDALSVRKARLLVAGKR